MKTDVKPAITITWLDVLKGKLQGRYRLYVMYDADHTCLYVGKSFSALDRLIEHLGLKGRAGKSHSGTIITDNMPDSLSWKIDLYVESADDPTALVSQDAMVDHLETILINQLSPIDNDRKTDGRGSERKSNPFAEHLQSLTPNSIKSISHDFADWKRFKGDKLDYMNDPNAWSGITWQDVSCYREWLLGKGYSLATVNRRVSTVRTYASIASCEGAISMEQIGAIRAIRDIGKEKNAHRVTTRIGAKKIDTNLITDDIARALKTGHAPTAQGAKDRLLMCLLIDLGLRASEVVALTPADVSLADETVRIYRQKTDYSQTLRMTRDVRKALLEYLTYFAPTDRLLDHSVRSLTARVCFHGKRLGYTNLSAHDLRHYLATKLAREGLSAHHLMEAMGWQSLATAQRYIEASAIANGAAAAIIDGED